MVPLPAFITICTGSFLGGLTKGFTGGLGSAIIMSLVWAAASLFIDAGPISQVVATDALAHALGIIPIFFVIKAWKRTDYRLVIPLFILQTSTTPLGALALAMWSKRHIEFAMGCVLLVLWYTKTPMACMCGVLLAGARVAVIGMSVGNQEPSSAVAAATSDADADEKQPLLQSREEGHRNDTQPPASLTHTQENTRKSLLVCTRSIDASNDSEETISSPDHGPAPAAAPAPAPAPQPAHGYPSRDTTSVVSDTSDEPSSATVLLQLVDSQPNTAGTADDHHTHAASAVTAKLMVKEAVAGYAAVAAHSEAGTDARTCVEGTDVELQGGVATHRHGWAHASSRKHWNMLLTGTIVGAVSGLLCGLTGVMGPPLMYLYRRLNLPKETVRACNSMLGMLSVFPVPWRLLIYWHLGLFDRAALPLYISTTVLALGGELIGLYFGAIMNQEAFKKALLGLMALCCALMFWGAAGVTDV